MHCPPPPLQRCSIWSLVLFKIVEGTLISMDRDGPECAGILIGIADVFKSRLKSV